MDSLIGLDVAITGWFRDLLPHNSYFNSLFSFLSFQEAGVLIFFMVGVLVVLYERGGLHYKKTFSQTAVLTGFAGAVAALLTNAILKPLFSRARPDFLHDALSTFICPESWSFPSGHAASAFAIATVLAHYDHKPARKIIYFSVALLIGYSRIYLDCHYFLDVLFGALLGISIGVITYTFPPYFTAQVKK